MKGTDMKMSENHGDASQAAASNESRQTMLAKVGAALVAATAASVAPAAAAPVLRRLSQPATILPPSIVIEKGVKLLLHNKGLNFNVFFGLAFQGSGSQQMGLGSVAVVNYDDTKSTEVLMKQLEAAPATCTIDNGVAQVSVGLMNPNKCLPNIPPFNQYGIISTMYPLTPPISDKGAPIIGNQKK